MRKLPAELLARLRKSPRAFTLVDVLVVFAVISILVATSSLSAIASQQRTRDAGRKTNLERIGFAVEEYYDETNCYPSSMPKCGEPLEINGKRYMDRIPCDPKAKTSYLYVSEGGACSLWFELYTNLEYTRDSAVDRVGCRAGCGPGCAYNYGVASSNKRLATCDATSPPPTSIPQPSASPSPVPSASPTPPRYVCSPGGHCKVYQYPELSGCPIFFDSPECDNACSDRANRCHDERGKQRPEE